MFAIIAVIMSLYLYVNIIFMIGTKGPNAKIKTFISKLITTYSSPVTGMEWPRGFQEVKVPRFHDNGTGWW
jgi:hypothetical protein